MQQRGDHHPVFMTQRLAVPLEGADGAGLLKGCRLLCGVGACFVVGDLAGNLFFKVGSGTVPGRLS